MSAIACLVLLVLCGLVVSELDPDTIENRPCVIGNRVYQHLERTPDECDRCWCTNGVVACNRRLCPPGQQETRRQYASCRKGDRVYQDGERTGDPCDRCWCANGQEACTYNMCYVDGVAV